MPMPSQLPIISLPFLRIIGISKPYQQESNDRADKREPWYQYGDTDLSRAQIHCKGVSRGFRTPSLCGCRELIDRLAEKLK